MVERITVLWGLCVITLLFSVASSTPVCEDAVADIVFLLDESGSVKLPNFVKVKKFVKDIVDNLKVGENNVRIGVVTFSNRPRISFHLNKYFDKKSMFDAIDAIKYKRGNTFTYLGLKKLRLSAFTQRNGHRKGVRSIVIVITDGRSRKKSLIMIEANKLKKAGVTMFSIGVGGYLWESELVAMASNPTSEHKFIVADFANLKSVKKEITMNACADSCESIGCENEGTCINTSKTWKCVCKKGFIGKFCGKVLEKQCYCSHYSESHYVTFDGQLIHFQGKCKYILAASTKGAPNDFVVEVKNEYRGNNSVSYGRVIDIKLKKTKIRILPGNKIYVNGLKWSLPINNVFGIQAKYSCGWTTLTTKWGMKVHFDEKHRVNVKVSNRFANKMTGICGDCNGKKDDFRTKQGKYVSKHRNKYYFIGNSYRVKDNSDKHCGEPIKKLSCTYYETRNCDIFYHEIFRPYLEKFGYQKVEQYVESCQIDACANLNNKAKFHTAICSVIEAFVGECNKAGITVDWRNVTHCPKSCPPLSVYKYATSICQPICGDVRPKCKGVTEGCVCRLGFLLSGSECVAKCKCGCHRKGLYLKRGEGLTDSKCERRTLCNDMGKLVTSRLPSCQPTGKCRLLNGKYTCVCNKYFYKKKDTCIPIVTCKTKGCKNGGICTKTGKTWKCICETGTSGKFCEKVKQCYCSGYGDPHYVTFDGQLIHFQGICKYTLAASKEGASNYFAIEVKNEHRENNRVSYTRLVDIKLKGVTIRLMPGNKMFVNGQRMSYPIFGAWDFYATYACGWIKVKTIWGLEVQFDGRHRVNVKITGPFANKMTGICGDCNGKQDDLRTKQGKDVSKYGNKYYIIGNSYRVKDDSDKPTTKCNVPDVVNNCSPFETRKCNLIKHKIFKKCIEKLGMKKVEEYVQSCRIDACVYRKNNTLYKTAVCSAIESFAGECAREGINVDWRKVAKCPMSCPPRQVYKYATPACQPSCIYARPKCRGSIEGCVCQKGFIHNGNQCVPKSECGCFYNRLYIEANDELTDSKCERKVICKAGGKVVIEELGPCQPNGICKLQNDKYLCVCKRGFYSYNGKCIDKDVNKH